MISSMLREAPASRANEHAGRGVFTGEWMHGPEDLLVERIAAAAKIAQLPPWPAVNSHLTSGRVGDKIKGLRVLNLGGPQFATQYGWKTIQRFRVIEGPDAGKLLAWFTDHGLRRFRWQVQTINATIKKFEWYEGEAQTVLTRVTVVED